MICIFIHEYSHIIIYDFKVSVCRKCSKLAFCEQTSENAESSEAVFNYQERCLFQVPRFGQHLVGIRPMNPWSVWFWSNVSILWHIYIYTVPNFVGARSQRVTEDSVTVPEVKMLCILALRTSVSISLVIKRLVIISHEDLESLLSPFYSMDK